jgi:DegV family protein with EDD domain
MKIIVDVMGGDNAPYEIIKGAVEAAPEIDATIVLVGNGKIIKETLELRDRSHAYFVVDDLSFLVKNGRLSGAAGFFAGLLKIKPVIEVSDDGRIATVEKIKTHSRAVERVKELIQEQTKGAKKVQLILFHTCREEDANVLKDYFYKTIENVQDIQVHVVTPAVGAHLGCGVLGAGYYILEK